MNEYLCFLKGKRTYLRPLTQDDITLTYAQWLNDEDVSRHNSHGTFPTTLEKVQEYFEYQRANSKTMIVLAVMEIATHEHLGNISLQGVDWVHRSAEFAIMIGSKKSWGKGVATEAASLVLAYGFERLNLNRIHCGTASDNLAMQRLAIKLGMQSEGLRRQALYKNGRYQDIVEYGILRSEWQGSKDGGTADVR